jgi:hypothetical protein
MAAADRVRDPDVRNLAALGHRVHRCSADAETLGYLANCEELLREHLAPSG